MVSTYSALFTRISKDIKNWLPRLGNCLDEDVELCPFTETKSIILEPSACELRNSVDITKNLRHISLLPCHIFLELDREILVFLDSF